MSDESEITFKIITVGESGVGKTSIFRRFVYNSFEENTLTTLGLQFSFKDVTLSSGQKIKLKLIDTAGEEKYRSLSKSYFKNADVALFVFSLNNPVTFEHINDWVDLFKENHDKVDKIPKYLIGSKNDLEQKVDQGKIDELAKNLGYKYISTSALRNDNIENLFNDISETVFKTYNPDKNQKTIKLKNKKPIKTTKCAICQV